MEIKNSPEPPPNTTIPILLCDKVISDNDIWYALRLTPFDAYQTGDIKELLTDLSDNMWCYSKESSSKGVIHYHIIFLTYKDPREDIKNWLIGFYPEKWKKEDGNKRYNLAVSEDVVQTFKYLLKDKGEILYGSDINPEFIEDCKAKSFAKYSKANFAKAFNDLKMEYHEDKITSKELRTKIIQLRGLYSQPIDLNKISQIVLSCQVRKDPTMAEDL